MRPAASEQTALARLIGAEAYTKHIWRERIRAMDARERDRRSRVGDVFRGGIVLPFRKPDPERKLHPCVQPLGAFRAIPIIRNRKAVT